MPACVAATERLGAVGDYVDVLRYGPTPCASLLVVHLYPPIITPTPSPADSILVRARITRGYGGVMSSIDTDWASSIAMVASTISIEGSIHRYDGGGPTPTIVVSAAVAPATNGPFVATLTDVRDAPAPPSVLVPAGARAVEIQSNDVWTVTLRPIGRVIPVAAASPSVTSVSHVDRVAELAYGGFGSSRISLTWSIHA